MGDDALADERAPLTARVAEIVAGVVRDAQFPGTLYGLVIAYGLSGLAASITPLFEITRASLLATGEDPHGLWDPTWADDYPLPDGAAEEMPDRSIEVSMYEQTELYEAFERYRGDDPESDPAYDAVSALWLDVAARLTRFGREGPVDVTDDFVALAYPHEATDEEVRSTLRHSLGPEAYRELESNGRVPI